MKNSATPGTQLGEKGPLLAEAKKGFYTSLDIVVRLVDECTLMPWETAAIGISLTIPIRRTGLRWMVHP